MAYSVVVVDGELLSEWCEYFGKPQNNIACGRHDRYIKLQFNLKLPRVK